MTEIRVGMSTSKCTPERCAAIVQAIREGNYRGTAARLAGLHETTVADWLRAAKRDREAGIEIEDSMHPEYMKLLLDIEEAEAQVEAELVNVVRQTGLSGAPNTWQAAMTFLERTRREKFGKNESVTIRGDEENPILVETRVLIDSDGTRDLQRDLLRHVAVARSGISSGVRMGDGTSNDEEIIDAEVVEDTD